MDTDYPLAKASVTGDWINAFIYVDENSRNIQVANGRAEYTVRRLEQGARHAFTVLTSSNFVDTGAGGSVSSTFAWPSNPRWEFHTVADRGGAPAPSPVIDYVTLYPNCAAVGAHYPGGATRSSPIYRPELDRDGDGIACGATDTTPQSSPSDGVNPAPMDTIQSSSTTASAAPEIRMTIASLNRDLPVGSSIVLYLEDDFQEPDSIPMSSVYLAAAGGSAMQMRTTGNTARAYVTSPVIIKTDAYFDEGKKDIAILVPVPDMCTSATDECEGPNGLHQGQRVSLAIEPNAGIKNPSEAGTHSVFFDVLGPTDLIPSASNVRGRNDSMRAAGTELTLMTVAKISLSDPDNKRGYRLTVTGSGFNNGTAAGVYVLHDTSVGSVPSGDAERALCERIIIEGTQVGYAIVGSDDRVQMSFEVTVPPFRPGKQNYICMADGEGRMSDTDVGVFHLEPALRVSPTQVGSGDTVTIFAQDFPNPGATFEILKLAGQQVYPAAMGALLMSQVSANAISSDGSATAIFNMPGGIQGTVRVDAQWGGVSEHAKITVIPSIVSSSQTDVLPNEKITITGSRFSGNACIPAHNITLDNVPVIVDERSLSDGCGDLPGVRVSNAGQFEANIILWPAASNDANPSLIPGTHILEVIDGNWFSGSVTLNIAEPAISITPDVAGPTGIITITGENWPVNNPENLLIDAVAVTVNDTPTGRMYSAFADAAGRFSVNHQVHHSAAIPSTILVEVKYGDIVKITTFNVSAANVINP